MLFTKKLFLLSIILILIFTVSCKETTTNIELDIPPVETNEDEDDSNLLEKGWQYDDSGNFSYLAYMPQGDSKPFFDQNYEFPENLFIYETGMGDETMYGYMNIEFKKLSNPISNEPNIFMLGMANIQTEFDSYTVNSNFEEIEEHYPGFHLLGNTIIEVNWSDKPVSEPAIIPDIDFDKYLVPIQLYINAETGGRIIKPRVGFKTVNNAFFNDIDPADDYVIPAVFDSAGLFHEGLAAVEADGKWGFVSDNGELIVPLIYDKINSFKEGVAAVYLEDSQRDGSNIGLWSLIDKEGNEIIPFRYKFFGPFINGLAIVDVGSSNLTLPLQTYIRPDGSRLTNNSSYGINLEGFSDGFSLFKSSRFHYIDNTGEKTIKREFSDAHSFSDEMAAVKLVNALRWGYIDVSGETAISSAYIYAGDFSKGYAFIRDSYKEPGFIINKSGEEFLNKLSLYGMTRFNEDGYALAYGIVSKEYIVVEPDEVTFKIISIDETTYYMIHLEY